MDRAQGVRKNPRGYSLILPDKNQAERRLNLAVSLAKDVGIYQLARLGSTLNIRTKSSPVDFVTEVDTNSQRIIVDELAKQFPTDKILAEEEDLTETNISEGWSWIIDPLDGTTNYTHGFPMFSVSIGIYHNLLPQAGVIYLPVLNEAFTAIKGNGAFLNGKQIHVSSNSELKTCMLSTGFPYDKATSKDNNVDHFISILKETHAVRRVGSAAIDLAFVACGRYDGYWELKLKPWDVSAGALLITEAGGIITNFPENKKSFDIFNSHILATNGKIHDHIIQILGG